MVFLSLNIKKFIWLEKKFNMQNFNFTEKSLLKNFSNTISKYLPDKEKIFLKQIQILKLLIVILEIILQITMMKLELLLIDFMKYLIKDIQIISILEKNI